MPLIIALKQLSTGKYVSAWDTDEHGQHTLVANRDSIGVGEKFEVVIVEGALVVNPIPQAPPTTSWPSPSQTVGFVSAVKDQLRKQGVDLSGPCGAFAITKRVAWELRYTGAGLLSKPGGNNCEGYATDIIAYSNRAFDILSDGGGTNGPLWNETNVDDLPGRWRPAVEP